MSDISNFLRIVVSFAVVMSLSLVSPLIPQANAVGAVPTVVISSVSGVVPYAGIHGAGYATQIGDTVTFTVTLSNLTTDQVPTGQVRITGDDDLRDFYCTTSSFDFSGTTATASCDWKVRNVDAKVFYAKYFTDPTKFTTDPNTSTDYLNTTSLAGPKIYVAGIYNVYGINDQLVAGQTYTMTAQTNYDFEGRIDFNLNASPLVGCVDVVVSSASATCTFTVPLSASILTFTFDYTPSSGYVTAGMTTDFASFPIYTAASNFYYPSEDTWESDPSSAYNATYSEVFLSSKFFLKDGLYYKLDAANAQAMVVAYQRSIITSTLDIPSSIVASSFTDPDELLFNQTYAVTQIGKSAFRLDSSNVPPTLISNISIPNSVTIIKAFAFYGQCSISTVVIPDSVRIIGADSLSNMEPGNAIPGCSTKSGVDSLTIGSGMESLGDNAIKGTTPSVLQFNGAPARLQPNNLTPRNFDSFQYNSNGGVLDGLGRLGNSCSAVISYSGIVTGNFVGTQLSPWRFWAVANGCIPNSNLTAVAVQLKPSPLNQPAVDLPTVSSLRVIWMPPISDGDSPVTGYSVQYSPDGGASWMQSQCSACQVTNSPLVVDGLSSSTPYIFRVNSTNGVGTSDWSTSSSPVSTLAHTSAPDFAISPTSEISYVGTAITGYTVNSTVASDSYSISPAVISGLSFDTNTGLLSGIPSSLSTGLVFTITGTNPLGSDSATFTLTVVAVPTPDAIPTTTPIPVPIPSETQTGTGTNGSSTKPQPAPTSGSKPKAKRTMVGVVYLATDSYTLSARAKKRLRIFAAKINASNASKVYVNGHADVRTGVNNTILSRKRARAVAVYLEARLNAKKLVVRWFAASRPAQLGTTSRDLALNRRVEIFSR